jgi:hypothetical protein
MLRFTIRDLLFLVVVVALALGWWFDRRPLPARFQMYVTTNHAFLLDTATGQVWEGRVNESGFHGSNDFRVPKTE